MTIKTTTPTPTMDHTFLYSIAGLAFYEDAKYGDTEAMLVKINGEFYPTEFFDRPTWEDATTPTIWQQAA